MRSFIASLALALLAAPAVAQPVASSAIRERADELVPIINGQGEVPHSFAASFLADIPEAALRALGSQLVEQLGAAKAIADIDPAGASAATFRILFERGAAKADMVIAPSGGRQIIGLRITATQSDAVSRLKTLDDVAKEIAELPGRAGFAAADLEDEFPRLVASLDPDRPLGIGSTFKLIVLAELVRSVNAGERGWTDLIPIDGSELPSGVFRDLPKGSRIPLRGLAERMIEASDNSATDILIRVLGRERIEAMQARLGVRARAFNEPFLTTLEAFKLKGVGDGVLGRRYLGLDAAGRRALLAGDVAKAPASAVGALFADGRPVMVDRIEWFASPADMARIMGWLKDQQGTPAGAEALRIMALNPGPASDLSDRLAYVGYKGGSEPGLLSMTLLLRDRRDRWRVISASWTNPNAPVDELRFSSLIRRAAELSLDRR